MIPIKQEEEKPHPLHDYIIVALHFIVLVLLAQLIPMTKDFTHVTVLIAFALCLVKTVNEVSRRF